MTSYATARPRALPDGKPAAYHSAIKVLEYVTPLIHAGIVDLHPPYGTLEMRQELQAYFQDIPEANHTQAIDNATEHLKAVYTMRALGGQAPDDAWPMAIANMRAATTVPPLVAAANTVARLVGHDVVYEVMAAIDMGKTNA